MLEIKLYVSDIDYDVIVDTALPKVADKLSQKGTFLGKTLKKREKMLGKIAHKFLKKRGQDGTEQLLVDLAKKKRQLLIEKASEIVNKKGIDLRIVGIDVKKC